MILPLILLPLAGAGLLPLLARRSRRGAGWALLALLLGEALLAALDLGQAGRGVDLPGLCGLGLSFRLTGFQALLSLLAALLWLVSGLAAREEMEESAKGLRYQVALLLTLGAIQGVFLSGDLYTCFLFFEATSFASLPLVLHYEDEGAKEAAGSYLTYALAGGLISLLGIFLLQTMLGTLRFESLHQAAQSWAGDPALLALAGGLTFVTFAAKLCAWPLHTWLPLAHPAAPAPASALLSGIITKAGVFGAAALSSTLFLGEEGVGKALLVLALVSMVWGGFQGLVQTNLKTTLAYSTMSQIGFILVGVSMGMILGEERGIALWGAVLHLVNHAWFKLLLFLFAGVLHHSAHALELDDLRGFGRGKKSLLFLFLMPALGLAGLPGWNGYLSKTLLHESIVEEIHHLTSLGESAALFQGAEVLFLLSGGMTAAYMAKLFVALFLEENSDPARQALYDSTPPHWGGKGVKTALLLGAALCPLAGLTPHQTMEPMARFAQDFFGSRGVGEEIHYFSPANLKGSLISLALGALLYFGLVRTLVRRRRGEAVTYRNPWPAAWSLEKGLYRPLLLVALPFAGAVLARLAASLFEWLRRLGSYLLLLGAGEGSRPPEDPDFAAYRPADGRRRGNRGTLAFGLTLFALGYLLVMGWLLLRNFVF